MEVVLLSCFSRVQLSVTPWTVARQAPLSMGFPRQEYWRGLPFPPPGDLLDTWIKPESSVSPVLAGGFFTTEPLGKSQNRNNDTSLIRLINKNKLPFLGV